MFKKEEFMNMNVEWEGIQDCNEALENLISYKKSQIVVEGSHAKSKIAWKIATLRQAYIWRLCELAESCTITWNHRYYIAALTLARGLIETGVMLCDFDENVQKGFDKEDLSFLDKEVMKKTFSTRIDEVLDEKKEYLATNIITLIQKKEKDLEGLWGVYENLSEYAHPNQFGHFQHYGELDFTNGTVEFSNGSFLDGKFHLVLCAFSFVDLSILAIERLAENIEKIAELQHAINPVSSG